MITRKCWADDVYNFPAWQARHKNERFARLSHSMRKSPAWMSLGKNAMRLYSLHCTGQNGPKGSQSSLPNV
nr:MAG TPA: hypothetical protein [Caudoviricetes sp.]